MFVNTADQNGVKPDMFPSAVAYLEGGKGEFLAKSVVPEVGFEPTRGCPHRFLSSYPLVCQRLLLITNVYCLAMRHEWTERAWTSGVSPWISAHLKAKWASRWASDFRNDL